jgi:hypothetical protein
MTDTLSLGATVVLVVVCTAAVVDPAAGASSSLAHAALKAKTTHSAAVLR